MRQFDTDVIIKLLQKRAGQHGTGGDMLLAQECVEIIREIERMLTVEKTEPQTNADAIRAMSDEELAEHLNDWQDWGGGLSTEMWLDWLRQPKEATP